MMLAYIGASSTVVAPQYTYVGVPYTPFGGHYGQTSYQTINPSLGHSAQMFQPVVIPPTYAPMQVPWIPMPCYPVPLGITSQYQQPPQAQALKSQQTAQRDHPGKKQTRQFDRKRHQRDPIPMTYAQLLPYLVQQGEIMPKEIP